MVKLFKKFYGINVWLFLVYLYIIGGFTLFAKNYEKSLIVILVKELVLLLALFLLCPLMFKAMQKIKLKKNTAFLFKIKPKYWKYIYFIMSFAVLMVYFAVYYPRIDSADTLFQSRQALSNDYSDWNPVIHTLITYKIPLMITENWEGSIILFQIIEFSLIFAYSMDSIRKYSDNFLSFLAAFFVILNPNTERILVIPWKDVAFGMGAMLLTAYSLNIFMTKGDWIKKPINNIAFISILVLTTFVRHNGILFTLPMLIASVFWFSKKRTMVIIISALMLSFVIKVPLYNALNVEKPGNRQVETLGLPMTVIGAVVTYSPESLDENTLNFAYNIAPEEVWESKYIYGNFNDVKWGKSINLSIIEEEGSIKVLKMMFQSFKSRPDISFKALYELTEPVYSVFSDKELQLTDTRDGANDILIQVYSNICCEAFPFLFTNSGAMIFLIISFSLAKTGIKNWKKNLFVLPVLCYNFGTLLLLTTYDDCIRFFAYTFWITPILLTLIFNDHEQENDTPA